MCRKHQRLHLPYLSSHGDALLQTTTTQCTQISHTGVDISIVKCSVELIKHFHVSLFDALK